MQNAAGASATPPSSTADHGQKQQQENHADGGNDAERDPGTRPFRRRSPRLRLGGVQPQLPINGVNALFDAALEIAFAEGRQNLTLDDQGRQGIGQHGFEPIADLDPDLALAGRDDEQDAVVLLGLTDAPGPAQLISVVLDLITLEVGYGDNDDLIACVAFQRLQPCGQRQLPGVT